MIHSQKIDFYRHLSFAMIGGFFGAYALLCRSGILANAQTMNLLELVINALRGNFWAVLLHLGVLAVYVAGTMLTVLLPHFWGLNNHRLAAVIDAAALLLLGFVLFIVTFVVLALARLMLMNLSRKEGNR